MFSDQWHKIIHEEKQETEYKPDNFHMEKLVFLEISKKYVNISFCLLSFFIQ